MVIGKSAAFVILAVMISLGVKGQTGPGGVRTSADNTLWLRADLENLTVDGSNDVSLWNDISGNSNNYEQTSGGNEPQYLSSGINSRPVISFESANSEHLETVAGVNTNVILGSSPGAAEVFIVFQQQTESASGVQYLYQLPRSGSAGSSFLSLLLDAEVVNTFDEGEVNVILRNSTNSGWLNVGSSNDNRLVEGTPFYIHYGFDGTDMFTNWDGISMGTAAGAPYDYSSAATADSNIGANGGSNSFFDGYVGEIIVYDVDLNLAEVTVIDNYLNARYASTIANDYYASTTFTEEVIGIGQATDGSVHTASTGSGGELYLSELNSSLNSNEEWVFTGHDGTTHGTTDNDISSYDRWERIFRLERTDAGGDNDIDIRIAFDTNEAGFGDADLGGSLIAGDYALLYRAGTSGSFSVVSTGTGFQDSNEQVYFDVDNADLLDGFYTLGVPEANTWYVFTNGDWSTALTWTLDASTSPTYVNPGNTTPQPTDDVVIRNGKTVTIQSGTNNLIVNSIEVNGTLDVTTSSGHNFTNIDGDGIIRMAGNSSVDNFPAGSTTGANGFSDRDNGGLLVIEGTGLELDTDREFNNIRIETTNNTDIISLGADYTVNGDFTVRFGTFQFGDGTTTARNMTVLGDFNVENNGGSQDGRVTTANANARHQFNLSGNLLNEGTLAFTQREAADFTDINSSGDALYNTDATDGIVDLNLLNDLANQTVDCNGVTNFYRIEIDKGADFTYQAVLRADEASNFNLLGPANSDMAVDPVVTDNDNALGLIVGTVVIGTNVDIPVLQYAGGTSVNYVIGEDARFAVDGGNVIKDGNTGAIVVYGELAVSEGNLTFDANFAIVVRENGLIDVSGGTLNANFIRNSSLGGVTSNTGGYRQSGGTVTIDDDGTYSQNDNYYIFSLIYPEGSFEMSGGTLLVRNSNAGENAGKGGAIFLNMDEGNYAVTGGTVIVESTANGNDAIITSRVPFYNLTIRDSGSGIATIESGSAETGISEQTITTPDLVVLNDLNIETGATLDAIGDGSDINDVYIGGSLSIPDGADYISRVSSDINSTFFNQTVGTDSIETFLWESTTVFAYDMGNMILDRNTQYELRLSSTSTSGGIEFRIRGDLEVLSGTLDQGALTLQAFSSVKNFDRLGTYFTSGDYPVTGGTPDNAQIRMLVDDIEVDEDGAIFGNVQLNSGVTNVVEFIGDVYMERFEHQEGMIYIGTNNLTIDDYWGIASNNYNSSDLSTVTETFIENAVTSSVLRVVDQGIYDVGTGTNNEQRAFIITDGNASDGGLSLRVTGDSNSGEAGGTNGVNNYDNINQLTYPIGFTTNPGSPDLIGAGVNTYYRPAQVKISDYSDDGYITIRPVSGELQTTDLSSGEILQHYWRVTHSDFSTLPTVAYRFYYRNREEDGVADLPASAANEADYVPGKVLDGGTYDRSYESDSNLEEDNGGVFGTTADSDTRVIIFNGDNTGTTDDDLFDFDMTNAPGFTLEEANYTAGESARFTGAPEIYYSRNQQGVQEQWNVAQNWSTDPVNTHLGGAASDYPQDGDVAVIGFNAISAADFATCNPCTASNANQRHDISITSITVTIAALDMDSRPVATAFTNNNSRIRVNTTATFNAGVVTGHGTIFEIVNDSDNATITGDFGDFNSRGINGWFFWNQGTNNTLSSGRIEYPTLRVFDGTTTNLANSVEVINLVVDADATFILNENVEADSLVQLGLNQNGSILFPNNSGTSVTLTCDSLLFRANAADINSISVENAGTDIHTLKVNRGIYINEADNFDLSSAGSNVILELAGEGTHEFVNDEAGITPDFYQIKMNKGSDLSNTFTIAEDFTIGDATSTFQPLVLVNGTLILNASYNSGAGILIANGSDLEIPDFGDPEATLGSAGLELQSGTLRVEGDDTGIILDGLLRISGGTLDMDDAVNNGNNFIQYTTSGNAQIDVSSGNLNVGSQIRRSVEAATGLLDYTQSGGSVRVGINAAPEGTRGVFEIVNSGSRFTHTAGDLTIVRQNGSSTVGSLIMQPDLADLDVSGSNITLGDTGTPASQNDFGVDATVALNTLTVNGDNTPTIKIFNNSLELNSLVIEDDGGATGTFDASGFDLTVNTGITNDGTFQVSGNGSNQQTTLFPSSGASTISGTGSSTFYIFNKTGSGTLTVSKDVTVANEFNLLSGTVATGSNSFFLNGDMTHDGTHTSDFTNASSTSGPGIVFQGSSQQNLTRSSVGESTFGTLTINNGSGVVINEGGRNFVIADRLRLVDGIFNIGQNLLTINNQATITNGSPDNVTRTDFSINNMISVNTSLVDKGVRKIFDDGSYDAQPSTPGTDEPFVYPMGLLYYTPVEVSVTNITGSNTGYLDVKPIDAVTGGVSDDDDELCDGNTDDYDDVQNVLQYYWLIKSQNVTDFDGQIITYHNDALESVNNSATYSTVSGGSPGLTNYAPARLLNASNSWDKAFSADDFDETNNITYYRNAGGTDLVNLTSSTIEGRYTAGITKQDDDNFLCGGAIPDDVPQYVTNSSGSGSISALGSFASTPEGAPPTVGESPDLVVAGTFELTLTNEFWRFRKVTIADGATLSITGPGVNLGTVTGTGTLKLVDNSDLPAGDLDEFFPPLDCSTDGGGIEYNVTSGTETVLAGISVVQNVFLTGAGKKELSNGQNCLICEDLDIQDNGEFELSDNSILTIIGDILKSASAVFDGDFSNAEIILAGSSQQTIDGDFTGTEAFNSLEVDNASGLTIVDSDGDDVEIAEELIFTNGLITTNSTNRLVINQSATLTNFSDTRYVDGPLVRVLAGSTAAQFDDFPVGRFGRYGYLELNNINIDAADEWTVEYIPNTAPNGTSLSAAAISGGVEGVSRNEYWSVDVSSTGNPSSNVRLTWNSESNVISEIENLVMMFSDPTVMSPEWDLMTTIDAPAGDPATTGNLRAGPISYSEKLVTFGTVDVSATPLPIELIDFSAEIVDEEVILTWKTASERNNSHFEIQRAGEGLNFTSIGNKSGNGTTDQAQDYHFIDYVPLSGRSYYRLRQVDFDGDFVLSGVVSVQLDKRVSLTMFPNPVTSNILNVRSGGLGSKEKVIIRVSNLYGGLLSEQTAHADEKGNISAAISFPYNSSEGIYIVTFSSNSFQAVERIYKQ